MRKYALLPALAMAFLSGCGSQDQVELEGAETLSGTRVSQPAIRTTSAFQTPTTPSTIPINTKGFESIGTGANTKFNPEHGKPGHRCDIAVGAPLPGSNLEAGTATGVLPTNDLSLSGLNSVAPTAPVSTAGLNPAHGQPGHRCDIAVGAPLNSPAGTGMASSPKISATSASPSTVAPAAAGLNPAHGKPGHRCDIAVGAPLDSKPATKPNSATIQGGAISAATKSGTNPAHGQPGHRCDIAVGAPLDSKPATTTLPLPLSESIPAEPDSSMNNF